MDPMKTVTWVIVIMKFLIACVLLFYGSTAAAVIGMFGDNRGASLAIHLCACVGGIGLAYPYSYGPTKGPANTILFVLSTLALFAGLVLLRFDTQSSIVCLLAVMLAFAELRLSRHVRL
jgi:hypothetical protein